MYLAGLDNLDEHNVVAPVFFPVIYRNAVPAGVCTAANPDVEPSEHSDRTGAPYFCPSSGGAMRMICCGCESWHGSRTPDVWLE